MSPTPPLPTPWPVDTDYPRFSDAEYRARWAGLRSLLQEAGASHALIAGGGAGRAELQFLCNAPVRWESLLVASVDDSVSPTLLVQLDNHAAGLTPWSTLPLEVAGPQLAGQAAALVGPDPGGAVAILGPISERLSAGLRTELPDARFVSLGAAFGRSRRIKSDEELRWTRYGAALCDRALEVLLDEAEPDLREDELGAILADAVARMGGHLGICFLATAPMTGGGAAAPNQVWSRRRTQAGDLVMFELSAGFGGSTGQLLRTIALDGTPTDEVAALHTVAEDVFDEIYAAIEPGLPVAELEAIGGRIEEAGYTIIDDLVHGYGGGYLPPHIRTPGTRREDPGSDVLEAGMLLVIQPNVVTADRRHGVQTGELVVVTADGASSLHSAPRGLLRVGG